MVVVIRATAIWLLLVCMQESSGFHSSLTFLRKHSTTSSKCVQVSAVATEVRRKVFPAAAADKKPEEPEGGWAPPTWKRKITHPLKDLSVGQGPLKGVVRNVEDFGAFIDIGAERDGFIHVSDISTEFIHQASDFLRSGKHVDCWITFVDEGQGKLSLTLIPRKKEDSRLSLDQIKIGEEMTGKIRRITNFGLYLDIGAEVDAFMHSTNLPRRRNEASRMALDELTVGNNLKVNVIEVESIRRRVSVASVDLVRDFQAERRFEPPKSKNHVFQRGPRPSE